MQTVFVGDLHGCADEFRDILREVGFRRRRDRLFLTGDAFTKGPDPLGVWKQIAENTASMVLGNHDARLQELLNARVNGEDESGLKPAHTRTLDQLRAVTEELLLWLDLLPLHIQEPPFLLVHAGFNPEKGFNLTTRDEFLTIRTWPPNGTIEGPRWHDHIEPSEQIIIFGHDAPGGLVEKRAPDQEHPYLLGLDTGCVYGNTLTAYILEEDEIVQVPSHQPPQH